MPKPLDYTKVDELLLAGYGMNVVGTVTGCGRTALHRRKEALVKAGRLVYKGTRGFPSFEERQKRDEAIELARAKLGQKTATMPKSLSVQLTRRKDVKPSPDPTVQAFIEEKGVLQLPPDPRLSYMSIGSQVAYVARRAKGY